MGTHSRPASDTFNEDQAYRDAARIGQGASNPVAIAGTLHVHSRALLHAQGTDAVRRHPALRVIAAQLGYLYGISLGPEVGDASAVRNYITAHPETSEV